MRILKLLLIAAVVTLLVGCARGYLKSHSKDYMQAKMTVPAIKASGGTKIQKVQDYYPLPKNNTVTTTQTQVPSIIPPGSNLNRFSEKNLRGKNIAYAKYEVLSNGEPTLVLKEEKISSAWKEVGRALYDSPYQIMDTDGFMHSYYILDPSSTQNIIKESTPIYRVYVQTLGQKNTQVQVLNKKNVFVPFNVAKRILENIQRHWTHSK